MSARAAHEAVDHVDGEPHDQHGAGDEQGDIERLHGRNRSLWPMTAPCRRLVVKVTCGHERPSGCPRPFTVAATAVASGVPVSLWLTGEASWLAVPGRAEEIELPHAAPLAELRDLLLAPAGSRSARSARRGATSPRTTCCPARRSAAPRRSSRRSCRTTCRRSSTEPGSADERAGRRRRRRRRSPGPTPTRRPAGCAGRSSWAGRPGPRAAPR